MTMPRLRAIETRLDALAPRRKEWERLAIDAIEPNPFYAHDYLVAAETFLHPGRRIRVLAVEDVTAGGTLCAIFPLQRPHWRDFVPFGVVALYRNPFTPLTTPLIRREGAAEILAVALAHLAKANQRLLLPLLPEKREFASLLQSHAVGHVLPLAMVDSRDRPAVETRLDAAGYRQALWSKNTRAAERRRTKRLSEMGAVTTRLIRASDPDGRAALEAFLALEARGWKGAKGSAMASKPATLGFANAAFMQSGADGDVWFEMLVLGGVPVAINVNLVAQGAGFAIKSAYDEAFASLGVGTLLDGHSLALATQGGPLTRFDSCAPMRHPIADRWRERERIARQLLGLNPAHGLDAGILDVMRRWLAVTGPLGIWRGYDA